MLVLGYSGSGKTRSIKHMDPEKTGVFLVEKTRRPVREQFKTVKIAGYPQIMTALKNQTMKSYVIDDSQYLLVNEFFDRAGEVGYQKFTDMALNFRNLIHFVISKAPEDVIVYFLHHTDTDSNGRIKAKTIGRMLDEKLTVEGCFDIVLRTSVDPDGHWFLTQSNGQDTVKSPEEMFPQKIPNDLALVDSTIREYYGLAPIIKKETEEIKK